MIISIMLGIIVIINMVQVLMLIVRGGKEQNIYQVLIFITGLVCNIGYFTLAISKSIVSGLLLMRNSWKHWRRSKDKGCRI